METNALWLRFSREVYGFSTQVLIKEMEEATQLLLYAYFPPFLSFFLSFFPSLLLQLVQ